MPLMGGAQAAQTHSPSLWRGVLPAAAIAFGGIALGVASAWVAIGNPWSAPSTQVGAWKTNPLAGSADADLYTRARVAVGALLALSREETLNYVAERDDSGQALRSTCSYRIEGLRPAARWWSATAYADDLFLFPNEAGVYSLNGHDASLDSAARFAVFTGPQNPNRPDAPAPLRWLPTPGDRGLIVTLRLYNPAPSLVAAPSTLVPPTIRPVGACA